MAKKDDKLAAVIEEVWGDEAENVYRTLERENSTHDPNAVNENNNGSVDVGIMQINSDTFNDFMRRKKELLNENGIYSYEDMYDPAKNIIMGKIIHDEQGWGAWYGAPDDLRNQKPKEEEIKKEVFQKRSEGTPTPTPTMTMGQFVNTQRDKGSSVPTERLMDVYNRGTGADREEAFKKRGIESPIPFRDIVRNEPESPFEQLSKFISTGGDNMRKWVEKLL